MTLTRAQKKEIYTHIITVIFESTLTSSLYCALDYDGAVDEGPDSLANISDSEIDSLKYLDDDGQERIPRRPERSLLRVFRDFLKYKTSINETIPDTYEGWMSITRNDFYEYRVSGYYPFVPPHPASTSTAGVGSPSPNPRAIDPVVEFKKSIKRDPSLFPELRDMKQWDTFARGVVSQAHAQDVYDVLRHDYAPTAAQRELFNLKQKYMYAVFYKVLRTDQGQAYVREHQQDHDAQKVWSKLSEYAIASTQASLDSSKLLAYITTARFGFDTWKGPSHSFILHWEEQVRLYGELNPTERLTPQQQRVMLENAVKDVDDLRAVKTQAAHFKTTTGQELTYDQYSNLLKSAAATYDEKFASKRSVLSKRRTVYEHQVDTLPLLDEYDDFSIDEPVDTIEAYAAAQRFPRQRQPSTKRTPFQNPISRTRLQSQQWAQLSEDARRTWDLLSEDMKKIILNPSSSYRQVHEHDVLNTNVHDEDNPPPSNESNDDSFEDAVSSIEPPVVNVNNNNINKTHPADLRRMMSSPGKPPSRPSATPVSSGNSSEMVINGKRYRQVDMHVTYHVSSHDTTSFLEALVDRGANGGIAGKDVRVINKIPDRFVNIRGIDNHEITEIPIVTAGSVVRTQHGDVIAIMHQYAWHGKGKTIHSSGQLEYFQNDVNDKSVKVPGGLQRIRTLDGYVLPLNVRSGLPYLPMRPYTDDEWDTLPHVILTSDEEWDPTILDHAFDDHDEIWYDAITNLEDDPGHNLFDEFGNYLYRRAASCSIYDSTLFYDIDDIIDSCVCASHPTSLDHISRVAFEHHVARAPPDYDSLRQFFGWLPTDIIKKTFECTTQYARTPISTILKKHYKSPFPAFNVHRRNESVATDTVFSDTPAIDDGSTLAQIFVGMDSLVTDAYGMKAQRQFVNTLEDNIRQRGAMNKLVSDGAQVEVSDRVLGLLRALAISSWQSEPYQQHQNPAERRWQTIKTMTNTLLDRSGSPAFTWLLCLLYVCFLLNNVYNGTINAVPLQRLTGSTNDISPILRFYWWQPIYYRVDDSDFPSESREGRGRWVGVAEHVGHAMTYKVLTDDTRKIIYRSNIRPANKDAPNYRLDPLHGEENGETKDGERSTPVLKSRNDMVIDGESDPNDKGSDKAILHPSDLVGRSFLLPEQDDGQRLRVQIVEAIDKYVDDFNAAPERRKFRCSVNDDQYEEILTYQQIMDYIDQEGNDPVYWKFKRITAHQGPLHQDHPDYLGSKYNVLIEWENGEITTEPLSIIATDDPVACAIYASDNGLLNTEGWKRFRQLAKNQKKFARQINQAKLRSYRTAPKYKYGYQVPRNFPEAVKLDEKFGNTKWRDATTTELYQLDEYNVFIDLGHNSQPLDKHRLSDYKKIRTHLIFDVKHDGRHKARMVADGHLTDIPLDSVYSGVVSLRGLRLLIFLAELNGIDTWATDIGNAYLEAETSEKVYIIAGPEFGTLEGHVLIIHKALYGLRTSGVRWHERFADCMREMGFSPCWAEPDIWMRSNNNIYEYIAVYVDDLAIAAENPATIVSVLTETYKFKLKGTGNIQYHLGMDFFRDDDGVLCLAPKKYIEKMMQSYQQMFGQPPRTVAQSPLEKGDHPELDDSELLDDEWTQKYQSLIGALQWAVSIGRIDIATAVMSMSSFRAAPRAGHLERLKRIYGYLAKFDSAALCIRVNQPDYSQLQDPIYDWEYSVYGNGHELTPHEFPEPLGNSVVLTHYVDANLYHDMLTGKAVTGILHFCNQTPIDWFSKKQSTVETATYGSEFVAARTCVEQCMELRHTLRYLGVPINGKSYMFGDNESVVNSSMHPHAKLHKRHTMLSFHRVRQAIAHKILLFFHIDGKINPADMVSKHWSHSDVWPQLQPLMFWRGDTSALV